MGIMRLGYMHVRVTDLAEAKHHYTEIVGLNQTAEQDGKVYFKGWDEWDHHSVVIEEGGVGFVRALAGLLDTSGRCLGWRVTGPHRIHDDAKCGQDSHPQGERDVPAAFMTGLVLAGIALAALLVGEWAFAIVAVLGGAYLAPFVAGIVLARHVIVRRPPFGTAMLAWVGLVGNVGVILAAIALLLLELALSRLHWRFAL